ncbi:MAG: 2-polyprenyl-3-methyl-5-hydroxy-6-metoxy-1,4-benzoquinol methylase [Chlamydiales bacterium]
MVSGSPSEKEVWEKLKELIGNGEKTLGPRVSKALFANPKDFGKQLLRYKFIAQMVSKGKSVLEFRCGEALGSPILSEESIQYLGVDEDSDSIEYASKNWGSKKSSFIRASFLGKKFGSFDAVVCLDVPSEPVFFDTVSANLHADGVCVCGVNKEQKNAGKIFGEMESIFHNVLTFCVNDSVIHTGDCSLADDLLFLGCYKR